MADGLFAPKVMQRDDPIALALIRLEVEDCDCPLDLDCPCGEQCPPGPLADCPECGGPLCSTVYCREHCEHCQGECDCPPCLDQPPCRHVLAAMAHDVSPEEWRRRLVAFDAKGYLDPPAPRTAMRCLDQAGRESRMGRRARTRRAIRHPGDLGKADVLRLSVDVEGGIVCDDGRPAEKAREEERESLLAEVRWWNERREERYARQMAMERIAGLIRGLGKGNDDAGT